LVGATAFSALGGGCAPDGERVLRSADAHPNGYPTVEAVRYMAKLLEERSDGRLKTALYAGGQLGSEQDTLEITIFGGLDFNRINLAPLNSIAKQTIVLSLPFIFRSIDHMRASVDGAPGQAILKTLEPHGLIGLCYYDSGERNFYTTKRLLETPDDLRGLKIRVQSSDLHVAMVEALGGDATPMSYGEVYQGLIQGVIDGAENNWPSFESSRHFEVAKYYSLTQHIIAPEVFVCSAVRWAKLSPVDRELIMECARDSIPNMRSLWDERVVRARTALLAAGVQTIEPSMQPFRDKVKPVWDRYISTPEMKGLVDMIERIEVA
jgi:tripartite ATP-independent transporter DctP family solute receptor